MPYYKYHIQQSKYEICEIYNLYSNLVTMSYYIYVQTKIYKSICDKSHIIDILLKISMEKKIYTIATVS